MNASAVRVRFAPSPTGFLHIGGVRTALFNYLYAKKFGGTFLLRIEDTDTERSEARFTKDILDSLSWLGMEAEEPILYQSERLTHYQALAEKMIVSGLAYRCFCTEEAVNASREEMMKAGKKPMYARTCRDLPNQDPGGRKFAVRAKFPLSDETSFVDLIRGKIQFPNADLDDFVMIRSNGVPTYNFVVVVDDIEMKISHVIRGDDHINNTPKQIYIYGALRAPVPLFAHLPMILGADKKKLSKRNGETSTQAYRTEGFLPEALMNFLVRLGWSHGDQEIFSMEEMIQFFDLSHVQMSGAVFNVEKLEWLAGEHMKKASDARLISILKADFISEFSKESFAALESSFARKLIPHLKVKLKRVKELAGELQPLLLSGVASVDATGLKWNKDQGAKAKTKEAIHALILEIEGKIEGKESPSECGFDHAKVEALMREIAEKHGLKLGDLTAPMRLFVTGQASSAMGLFDLIPIMPWKVTLARLNACLAD